MKYQKLSEYYKKERDVEFDRFPIVYLTLSNVDLKKVMLGSIKMAKE